MTPGRKYMSAINVYYGLQNSNVPIQVFYLHLEESKYQDIPYPLTPIIKNELVDIIDSTEIFTKNIDELKDNRNQVEIEDLDDIVERTETYEEKRDKLILIAISKGLSSKNKINRFLYEESISIQGSELRKLLKKLESKNLIKSIKMVNKSTEYIGYKITDKGLDFLKSKEGIRNE